MKRIISLILLTALIMCSTVLLYADSRDKDLFTPCQYKNSYKYYMEKGEEYLADNQLESAYESYKRALIVQPNSKEARLKATRIRQMLSSKRDTPRIVHIRRRAIASAMRQAKEMPVKSISAKPRPQARPKRPDAIADKSVLPARKRPASYTSSPRQRVAAKQEEKTIEPELAQTYPTVSGKRKAYAEPSDYDQRYSGYMNLEEFNNGINDKIQQGMGSINSRVAPAKITGKYRLCAGLTNEDFIWKDANADYHNMPGDTSWRYVFGQNRQNSYDKKVYSRLQIDADMPITDTISAYSQMVIDPWTFVGKKRVYVTGTNGDNVQIDYKYWSNVRRTINETYRTERGDIVSIAENKVKEGKTSQGRYTGLSDWGSNTFNIPEIEIDRMYVPIRKSWVEYDNEPYHAKVFSMAGQEEALTSDDPMRLSNNKIWWEESPWLDTYESSRVFERTGDSAPSTFTGLNEPLKKGQWVRNQSFVARDSDDQRLTFLRGASFSGNFDNGTSVNLVAAAPRNLWDRYEQATSIPAAVRVKSPITENLALGGTYTFKGGMRHNSLEAMNNLLAIDASYGIFDNIELLIEGAVSSLDVDEASGYDNHYTGYASMVGLKSQGPLKITGGEGDKYEVDMKLTHMDDKFFPGLSNYRFTRKDFEFAKHIYFDETNPKNEAIMVGDGADIGRNSFNLRAKGEFPDSNIESRFDFRTVHTDGGDHIENVYRLEGSYQATPKMMVKGLAYYQHLPKTKEGIDPLMNAKNSYSAFTDYFAYDDIWLENTTVPQDQDPSIGAFSAGLKYDFTDYFSGMGTVEMTNDPKDWPRGLFNNVYVTDEFKDDVVWDKIVPFLYDQGVFGIPGYSYYGIYKTRFTYYPFEPIKITLNYAYNENKYAMAVDGNSTHQGIELEYMPNDRLTLGFLYQYTRQRDLYKEFVLDQGTHFDGHHNIFAALGYQLNKDQHLTLTFGEYVGYSYPYAEEHNSLTALDTRHIVRVMYTGGWGEGLQDEKFDSSKSSFKPLGALSPAIPGAKLVANLSGGWAKYTQNVNIAPVESKWENGYGKIDFGLDAYDREYWEGSLKVGLFTTLEDQEKWDRAGVGEYQTDDMDFSGADISVNIGWAMTNDTKYISVTPLLNAGYRRIEFARSNISTTSTVNELGEVDEHFNISYLGIGGKVDLALAENMILYGGGYWAPLVYASTKNQVIGSLLCNKGDIYHAEGGCDYTVSDRLDINIGGFWDLQHLDRTERIDSGIVSAELPDSKLETFGLTLGGLYKF